MAGDCEQLIFGTTGIDSNSTLTSISSSSLPSRGFLSLQGITPTAAVSNYPHGGVELTATDSVVTSTWAGSSTSALITGSCVANEVAQQTGTLVANPKPFVSCFDNSPLPINALVPSSSQDSAAPPYMMQGHGITYVEPMSDVMLRGEINEVWQVPGGWLFTPIGRGYYIIQISNYIERDRILEKRIWNFKHGTARLQRWTPEFNPWKVNSPIAHVWIRIHELPIEYFSDPIIRAIASAIGPVINIDERTRTRRVCKYARVLVEVDLRAEREYSVMYERQGFCSIVSVSYEHLPEYYTDCGIIGHSVNDCRRHAHTAPSAKPPARKPEASAAQEWQRVTRKKSKAKEVATGTPMTTNAGPSSTAPDIVVSNSLSTLVGSSSDQPHNIVDDLSDILDPYPNDPLQDTSPSSQPSGQDLSYITVQKQSRTQPRSEEYSIRKPPLGIDEESRRIAEASSQPYVIGPVAQGENAVYSWADYADDSVIPPKHGPSRGSQ